MEHIKITMYCFSRFPRQKMERTGSFLAYVALLLKAHLTIYRSPLYVKMDASYKRKTDHVENGTLWLFSYTSIHFHVQKRAIYRQKRMEKESVIDQKNFWSVSFSIVKNVENGTYKNLHVPFSTFFTKRKTFEPVILLFETHLTIYYLRYK